MHITNHMNKIELEVAVISCLLLLRSLTESLQFFYKQFKFSVKEIISLYVYSNTPSRKNGDSWIFTGKKMSFVISIIFFILEELCWLILVHSGNPLWDYLVWEVCFLGTPVDLAHGHIHHESVGAHQSIQHSPLGLWVSFGRELRFMGRMHGSVASQHGTRLQFKCMQQEG